MEEKDIIKPCEVAAQWWTDRLGTHIQNAGFENELANILLALASMQDRPSDKTKAQFYELLKLSLVDELQRKDKVLLNNDYAPSGILGEVASICGISNYAFPCKTNMRVSVDEVVVSEGYRAPEKVIYSREIKVDDSNENLI